ncbi:MAG: DUF2098 domain-containing protein [Methanosphaera sp.]|uniref:DUF2098 domain-containing protein n=1 Tax=Methanosphaera sp. TaxID=2666342 RepID=UPI0025F5112A|nr:DUF2098 domain-containing protein [Methanosphaera sp.]MCI5867662.1 DUF2098 domain-containing protein [Methanosphaera sp.]MDD6534130.1 DUF2098 domain-containing protein [Methanosphaera sp.]MDY3956061.1 DUF2098 domain-containing protein [Methanosphaera sp.]
MVLKDKQGREIDVGTYIIYPSTGTIGEVLDIKNEDGADWVLIEVDELTRLWYNVDFIEVTDKSNKKQKVQSKDDLSNEEKLQDQLSRRFDTDLNTDGGVGGG